MKVSVRGQEVHNSLVKGVIVVGFVTIIIPIGIVTLPISIPLHFALKAMGRNGFFQEKRIVVDCSSFSRA